MSKIIMLKGLPASGKSSYAKKLLEEKQGMYKRVNRDLLREMLDNGKWSKNNEKGIVSAEKAIVRVYIMIGCSVIIDDCNLSEKGSDMWDDFASELGAKFEVVDFTDVPIDECIRRDQKRANYVGEKVIKRMHNQFLSKPTARMKNDNTLPKAIVCDLDGSLALHEDRSPYDTEKCETDVVNESLRRIINSMTEELILVSGREST